MHHRNIFGYQMISRSVLDHHQMIWKRTSLDPKTNTAIKWNFIVLLAGVSSLCIDFLFLYIPVVGTPNTIYMDWQLGRRIAISRSVVDLIVLCGMIMKYHIPSKYVLERRDQTKHSKFSKLTYIVVFLAILPFPQVFVGLKMDFHFTSVMTQLPFKAVAMSPYPRNTLKMMRILMKNAWIGALLNLFYFIIISHAVGAWYYDAYIYALSQCSNLVSSFEPDPTMLDWDEVINRCTQKYGFEYGIAADAFSTNIGRRSFIQKYTYCLAWGLKSLSSFGQIFSASAYTADTIISLCVVVFGLLLFGDLLAKMQTALQCTEVKEDRQRTRQRIVEEWMKYHQLPQPLKKQVKRAIQSEWSTTRGVNDEAILDSLPWDIRSKIRRHLYLEIIRTMPLFEDMDDDLVYAICGYLQTFSSNKGTYLAFEGEPVHQMLFVFSGELEVSSANDGGKCITLRPGDLCGKELLEWCSHPTTSTENLKPATQTIKCITDVDAFALKVDDVKLLAIQFHRDGKFCSAFQRYTA